VLAFAGDVHFDGRVRSRLDDPTTAFGPAAQVLAAADWTAVNLETAITGRGTPQSKTYHFRAPASAFAALRAAGVDAASMANNHAADYGRVGLDDTLAAIGLTAFPVAGLGADAQAAYAPVVSEVKGTRVALVAGSQVRDETLANWTAGTSSPGIAAADSDRLVASVRAARGTADVVVVFLHWGVEHTSCPSGKQQALARRLSAAGADLVIGAHPHELQGAGWLGRTYVAYSLGNYLWHSTTAARAYDTGVLRVTVAGRRAVAADFLPARIDGRGIPVPLSGRARTDAEQRFARLRSCAGLSAAPG
jgi:poly-gamma-glutamate capsule biosynthesis protein CapA/YwtB (metallophosphatase superfamily)